MPLVSESFFTSFFLETFKSPTIGFIQEGCLGLENNKLISLGWEPPFLGWDGRHKKFQYQGLRNGTHFPENMDEKEIFLLAPYLRRSTTGGVEDWRWVRNLFLCNGEGDSLSLWGTVSMQSVCASVLKMSGQFHFSRCTHTEMLIGFSGGPYCNIYSSSYYRVFPSRDLAIFSS